MTRKRLPTRSAKALRVRRPVIVDEEAEWAAASAREYSQRLAEDVERNRYNHAGWLFDGDLYRGEA